VGNLQDKSLAEAQKCVTANGECRSLLWVKDLSASLETGLHDMKFNGVDSRVETYTVVSPIMKIIYSLQVKQRSVSVLYQRQRIECSLLPKATKGQDIYSTWTYERMA